jgi:hypothetical protein
MLPTTALKQRTVLTPNTYSLFHDEIASLHAPKSAYLADLFDDQVPKELVMPQVDDMVTLGDGTLTTSRRFEGLQVAPPSGPFSLTTAGIKSFDAATRTYIKMQDERRLFNAGILSDIQANISPPSLILIKNFCGSRYDATKSNLLAFYTAMRDSHSRADPVSMMETLNGLWKLKMSDDFYEFSDVLCKQTDLIKLKFKNYFDATGHVDALFDTLYVTQLAMGVSKRPEYAHVIDLYRDMDLSKPGGKQFSALLEKLSAATRSAAILKEVEGDDLLMVGASSKTTKSSKAVPQAKSSETSKTQTLCVKCQERFDVTKNIKTGLMFNVCKKCWLLALKQKKVAAPNSATPSAPKKTPVVSPATAKNFSGGSRPLPASSSTVVNESEEFITSFESDFDSESS